MRGKRTSEEKREQVKTILYLNPEASIRDIEKQTGIPQSTVQDIKKSCIEELNSDEFAQYRAQKKLRFIDKAWELIDKSFEVIEKKLDTLVEDPEKRDKINVRDMAITMGTLYDKQALANGEPINISERTEPTPELMNELEAKVRKLKEMTGI